jgi:hypothetical protein
MSVWCQKETHALQQIATLFDALAGRSINNGHRLTSLDQFIGAQQECFRDRQVYRLCGLEVDYEFLFGR